MPGRREHRFDTTLPVTLEQGSGVVWNVSASGIYFVTDVTMQKGDPVSFTLEFNDSPSGPLKLRCIAQVVRVEECDGKFGVGAAISSFEFQRLDHKPAEPS